MGYRERIAEILATVRGKTGNDVWTQALLDLAQLVDEEAGAAFDEGLDEGEGNSSELLDTEYQEGYDAGYSEGFDEGLVSGYNYD